MREEPEIELDYVADGQRITVEARPVDAVGNVSEFELTMTRSALRTKWWMRTKRMRDVRVQVLKSDKRLQWTS